MLVHLVELGAREALLGLIEEINRNKTSAWGLALIKRPLLKLMSNDDVILEIKPLLQDAVEAQMFVLEGGDIYIAWLGMQKRIYNRLCAAMGTMLRHPESMVDPASAVVYFDPQVIGNEIITLLKSGANKPRSPPHEKETLFDSWRTLFKESALAPDVRELEIFHQAAARRPNRRQLEILVVEDQQLLRRLLHEILRAEHTVDSVATMHEGWKHYLQHAPNIAFLDIGLGDGSGHDLAKAIKQFDPASCVVMVTANNTADEMEIARMNHVDGFVGKPYSKQQISKFINKYIADHHLSPGRYQSA